MVSEFRTSYSKDLIYPFLTKEDRKLLAELLKTIGMERINIDNPNNYPELIEKFDELYHRSEGKICNDLPPNIVKSLTKDEWKKIRVEFNHYNRSLDEIHIGENTPLPDYCVFYLYKKKFKSLIKALK